MSAREGLPPPIKSAVRRIKKIMAHYEVKNQILSGVAKISSQNSNLFGDRNFLKILFFHFEFFDLKIWD